MTWWLLAGLLIGCYFFKVAGLFVAENSRLSPWADKVSQLFDARRLVWLDNCPDI